MIVPANPNRYTPEDLLTIPDGDQYELVDGELIFTTMSMLASKVASRISTRLDEHCQDDLGWVLSENATYQCFPNNPSMVRKPDVSFILAERVTSEEQLIGHITIPPDLAVEVLSPNDLAYAVDEKIKDYLDAGVRLVWVVNPEVKFVTIHRADGSGKVLRESDWLEGEDVVPGFRCALTDVFRLPKLGSPSK